MAGIKMGSALDRLGQIVRRNQMAGVDTSALTCRHCLARVNFVAAYTKQSSKVTVQAFFRLNAKQVHGPHCPHNVAGLIECLASESRDAEGAHPILVPAGADQFVLRLNLLCNVICGMDAVGAHVPSPEDAMRSTYRPDGRMLASYLRSATGVAKLRSLVSDRSEVEDRIRIQYHDEQIPWRDFFFDDDRFEQLYVRLSRHGQGRHPVAVAVTTKVLREWKTGQWRWLVQCFGDTATSSDGRKRVIPDLLFADADLWKTIHPNREYVVVAMAEAKENDRFRTLVIRITHPSQMALVEIDADQAAAGGTPRPESAAVAHGREPQARP